MAIDDHSVENVDFVVISRNVSPSALDAFAKDNKTVFGVFFFFKNFVSIAYESPFVSNCIEKKN